MLFVGVGQRSALGTVSGWLTDGYVAAAVSRQLVDGCAVLD